MITLKKTMKYIIIGILLFFPIGAKAVSSCPVGMLLVGGFCIDTHETTNAEYQKNIGRKPYVGAKGYDKLNQPRVMLNWYEADTYCKKLGKRLPMEAEWTKAAAINVTKCETLSKRDAVYQADRPAPVCSKRKNPYGLCDMIGNVWEWVSDWDKSGKQKVMLGGSCFSCQADDIFDVRSTDSPESCGAVAIGVRCALELQ